MITVKLDLNFPDIDIIIKHLISKGFNKVAIDDNNLILVKYI